MFFLDPDSLGYFWRVNQVQPLFELLFCFITILLQCIYTDAHTQTQTHLYTREEIIEFSHMLSNIFGCVFCSRFFTLTHTHSRMYTLCDIIKSIIVYYSFTFFYIFFQIILKVDLSIATVPWGICVCLSGCLSVNLSGCLWLWKMVTRTLGDF